MSKTFERKEMGKKIIVGVLLLTTSVFLYLGIVAITRYLEKSGNSSEIPPFGFVGLDGEMFTRDDLSPDRHVIIVYANPDCEPCERAIGLVAANRKKFRHCQMVMVFPFDAVEVERFLDKNRDLNEMANLSILLDPFRQFSSLFGHSDFPSFFVYRRDGRLARKIEGLSDINLILEFIEN